MIARPWLAVIVAGALAAVSHAASAQRLSPPTYVEYRADAIVGRGTALEAGGGVVAPLGIYVRFNVDAAAGATWRNGATNASGRIDAVGRFLLDPYREEKIGFSLGGGVSMPFVQREARSRPYLTAVVDIEGRFHPRYTPAVQIGLGGGARIGVLFRTSPGRWR